MSSFDDERNEYRIKVGKQRDAIVNLLDLSDKHPGLFDFAMIKELRKYREKCEKLYRKLDKNEFEIAIVGLEKAGKSTFGNALMGNRILPDADERCTYTSTCIRYGNDQAVVKFFNMGEMDGIVRGYLSVMGIENVDSFTYQGLTSSGYTMMFNKLDQKTQNDYRNTVHQDLLNLLENKNEIIANYVGQSERTFSGQELYEQEFRDFITSPRVAVAVKEVSIESSKLSNLQNAVIYDVPGFDSPTSMHLEQTKERMKEADAILLIASAFAPSITGPALNMFKEVVDEDNVSLGEKLFIFGNKADLANTLKKNIQTLKNEAVKWNMLSSNLLDERVIVGSAFAHLQSIGIIEKKDAVEKIESEEYKAAWSHGDGIEYTYSKLVRYNETERFEVTKNKVLRNNEGLKTIIKELEEKYSDRSSGFDFTGVQVGTASLRRESSEAIQQALEELREEVRTKYKQDRILSQRLQEEVTKLFDEEGKYSITDEDITYAKRKIIDTDPSKNVEKVEDLIREAKFTRIYDDFSKSAFLVAQNDHTEYYDKIVKSFEAALRVTKASSNYEKIHNLIIDFIGKYRKNDEAEFIYRALIERFVMDVVEVLVLRPYSSEARLNKFIDAAEVFSGLVMFYNPGDANEGYKKQFLSVAPKNQPLLLALVFHDYKESDVKSKEAMNLIGGISKSLCDNPEIVQLAYSIIKQDPISGVDAIRKMVVRDRFKHCKEDDDFVRSMIPTLRDVKKNISIEGSNESDNSTKKHDFDFSNSAVFAVQYKKYFGNKKVRDYENVKEFFEEDLAILEKFLVHASIPAIRLEKPFITREVQSINKLVDAVKSVEYDTLIAENAQLFLPDVYERLNISIANFTAHKAAVDEAKKILKTLDA